MPSRSSARKPSVPVNRRIPQLARLLRHCVPAFLAIFFAGTLTLAAPIRSDRWLADVKYLSSDDLKGRGDSLPELDKAASYIADEFRKAGLQPLGGTYFQPFEAVVAQDLGKKNSLSVAGPVHRSYKLKDDFTPLDLSASGELTVPMAFVGYGITAPEYHYDDYAGIDVHGKAVLVLRHEPQENDDQSIFLGRRLTRYAQFVSKVVNARAHGAAAVIFVNDPLNHSEDKLIPFGQMEGESNMGIVVLQVKEDVAGEWLRLEGKSLPDLQQAIDRDLSNHSFLFPADVDVKIDAEVNQRRRTLKNVAGYLPGSDASLRDQVIVIGGHYDHLGLGEQGTLAPSQIGQIHHGADDNASGTAGVMELARSFSADHPRPRHSILFLAFAGEELGLLGSAAYVKDPLIPLDRTIAMVNLDMIGRMRDNKLYVGGVGTSPGFRQLVQEEDKGIGLSLDFSDAGYDASDHMSFGRNQIPVLFFFSGLHSDYHKPSDTWDKVEPQETAQLLELVRRVVVGIDTEPDRPAFTQPRSGRSANAGMGSDTGGGGYGPYFGSVPDFGESGDGVKFADVRQDSPAAKAGLKPGDVLVKFDGQEVHNLYDFTYALQGKKPGDEVSVTVMRGNQPVQAIVKLTTRD